MVYCPGIAEEEALHQEIHGKRTRKVTEGLPLRGFALKTISDELEAKVVARKMSFRIVRLIIPKARVLAARVLAFVDAQLKAVQASSRPLEAYQMYLAVDARATRVIGIVVAHPQTQACRAVDQNQYDPAQVVQTVVGISRMWAAPSVRKAGVMTRLLDAILDHYAFQSRLDPFSDIAFTQLTQAGYAFARRYLAHARYQAEQDDDSDDEQDDNTRSTQPLVYSCIDRHVG